MKKFIVILLIVVILFGFGIQSSSGLFYVNNANAKINSPAPIWPMFHYNAKRTGRCPYDTSKLQATLKWRYRTGSNIYSSPAIGSDGTIYVGSYDHYLYAINPNGTKKWRYSTGNNIYSSPAIGSDGTIYVGSWDNYLYAINPNGTLKWKYSTGNNIYSSPAIGSDGTVYVGSWDNYLYAINPNGTLKWKYSTGSNICSSPAIGSDGTVYVGSWDNYLYAIRPDGTKKWRYRTDSKIASSPAIGSDGTVYVGSWDKYLYAINPDGTLKWRYEVNSYIVGSYIASSPAIGSDGTIYVGSDDYYLYAINPDGTKKWRYRTGYGIYSSPAIGSDGTVYVGSWDNYLYAIRPDGTKKWRYRTDSKIASSPAIGSDGTIYVGSEDHYLYAIGYPNLPAPQHFKVSSSGTTVRLTWDYPSFNEGGTLWFNYYESNPHTYGWDYKGHTTYPTKEIVITNQSYGKHQYRMRVKYSTTSCYSDYTASAIAYVLRSPSNLSASSSGTTSTLTWDYPSFNEGGTLWFNYYEYNPHTFGWDHKGHTAYPTKEIVITNQSCGKHQYRMRVKYSTTSCYSDYTGLFTDYILHKPTSLTAMALSPTQVKLTYDPIDANATKIKVDKSTDGTSFSAIETVSASTPYITVKMLSPETDYYFKITALRDSNSSFSSDSVDITTPAEQTAPTAPTNLIATVNSCSEVALSWSDNSDNEEHFVIERKEASGSYSVLATVDPDTTLYTDSTVEGNKTYYYRVKATNTTGDSSYVTSSAVNVPACAIAPQAPTNLAATAISSSEIDLSWSDNSNNEDGFKIERKTAGGTYSAIVTVGSNVTTYKDTGLNSGTTYYYRVRAFNSEGVSTYSNEVNATTQSNAVQQIVIKLQPDNEMMLVNDKQTEIDPGRGTKPVIIPKWSRTVVPIRAVVEALGGTIEWEGTERKVTVHFNGTTIELWIDNPKAGVNGIAKWIDENNHDVKPIIINSRTMLPLRFVAESLGCKVDWDHNTRTITITYPKP